MKFQESILINIPAKKVFKYLSNFNFHKKFTEHYKDSKQMEKGTLSIGSELFTKIIFLGRKIENYNEVFSYVPDKEFGFKAVKGPVPSEVKYVLEPKGEGDKTEVILQYSLEPGSFFNMEEIFLRPRFADTIASSMKNLKRILEAKAA